MTMHLCSPGLEPDLDIISSEQLKHHVYFFAAKTSKLQVDVLPEICGQLSPLFWNSFHYCRQPIHWSSLSFFPSARNGRNFIKGQFKQFKIPQRSAKHREPSASTPTILDNAVLQVLHLFRHCHRIGK